MKKDWQKLSYEKQKDFKDKAGYLIDRGYVQGKTVEELAIEIYKKNG